MLKFLSRVFSDSFMHMSFYDIEWENVRPLQNHGKNGSSKSETSIDHSWSWLSVNWIPSLIEKKIRFQRRPYSFASADRTNASEAADGKLRLTPGTPTKMSVNSNQSSGHEAKSGSTIFQVDRILRVLEQIVLCFEMSKSTEVSSVTVSSGITFSQNGYLIRWWERSMTLQPWVSARRLLNPLLSWSRVCHKKLRLFGPGVLRDVRKSYRVFHSPMSISAPEWS
jgi:hypothetical protein